MNIWWPSWLWAIERPDPAGPRIPSRTTNNVSVRPEPTRTSTSKVACMSDTQSNERLGIANSMETRDEMDVVPDGPEGFGSYRGQLQRACDHCRSRKIRCDRRTPCSNCRASKLRCQTTVSTQKVQKQRLHISEEYEGKIDRIENRLTNIEHLLESLVARLDGINSPTNITEQSRQTSCSRNGPSPRSTGDVPAEPPAPFEGETALNPQSEYARELLEKAVDSTPSIGQNPDIREALASLQRIVGRDKQPNLPSGLAEEHSNQSVPNVDHANLDTPPWGSVNDIIDKATAYPTMSFTIVFPFLKLHDAKTMFQETLNAPEDFPAGRRLLIFGLLYHMYSEFATYPLPGQNARELSRYGQLCRKQMDTAMSQLDLWLPATFENILALMLAASYAVELCKPSLCWLLTSTAATLSQRLGYHRLASMKDDTPEERSAKIHVFWFIYTLDKTLSLRLGRASAIQDWDISLPYPGVGDIPYPVAGAERMTRMQVYWIRLAQLQARTYEQLFSPAAFQKTAEARLLAAKELVDNLNQAFSERGSLGLTDFRFSGASRRGNRSEVLTVPALLTGPVASPEISKNQKVDTRTLQVMGDLDDTFYYADCVLHYSTIALIERAVCPNSGTFSPQCLEAARAALRAHQKCNKQFNVRGCEEIWSCYVHWSILQAPFTPFIVLFCNAISTCSHADLKTLSDFVDTLESCRFVSEGAQRLWKMCQNFLLVARLYLEAKSKEHPVSIGVPVTASLGAPAVHTFTTGEQIDYRSLTQIDPYLSALGLEPTVDWPLLDPSAGNTGFGHAPSAVDANGFSIGNHQSLEDWFSGSRYIMGLMETDNSMIDLPAFNL
ncbi:uncharacterized protein EI97DRAFT_455527 [Westerdykella ornata]|uniref:Zn(2)-C6 fungal-type domain-containing protein n=1 Tax=Westerdykella ornata TaxID=318751 RepID=A0A6A6JTU6_WESOR|nr:uncharacterized protein EI97DRAFT_455527 [Westerdykella ornata]KAF2279258.1 hypothetical protein EI97DRAFT_455527 [Westerdykella ornata]